jgi:hypothetical protein
LLGKKFGLGGERDGASGNTPCRLLTHLYRFTERLYPVGWWKALGHSASFALRVNFYARAVAAHPLWFLAALFLALLVVNSQANCWI